MANQEVVTSAAATGLQQLAFEKYTAPSVLVDEPSENEDRHDNRKVYQALASRWSSTKELKYSGPQKSWSLLP